MILFKKLNMGEVNHDHAHAHREKQKCLINHAKTITIGASCAPMGGDGCRQINSRYCGGNLNFAQAVSRQKQNKNKCILSSP